MSINLSDLAPPVLIVGFRRYENLRRILQICDNAGVTRIYVTLDGPRSEEDGRDISTCESVSSEFANSFAGSLKTRTSQVNQGAAYSVLSGCDWVFEFEDFAVVIEDDCLPSPDFFTFIGDAKRFLSSESNICLIGGTQFVPSEITADSWYLSEYPLIWGWATSREKWLMMRHELQKINYKKFKIFKTSEYAFWETGASRAFSGFVDAWDTPLVHILKINKWLTILPGRNLVTNIGNDFAATHTLDNSRWLGLAAEDYMPTSEAPKVNIHANRWLRDNLYRISSRHLFSTSGTRLLDLLRINEKKRSPLLHRWN